MRHELPGEDEFEQAADFIEDIDEWTDKRRDAFLAWISERPENLAAAQHVWAVFRSGSLDEALRRWTPPSLELVRPAAVATPLTDRTVANDDPAPTRRRRWIALSALAATIVLGVVGILTLQFPARPEPLYLEAAGAAPQKESLADGSIVHIDAQTRIAVELADDARRIKVDHGRALVEVAPDKSRPLTISSGDVEATAIGTAFSVDRYDGAVTVRVEHGRVRVQRGEWSDLLNPGEGSRLVEGRPPEMLRFTPSTDLAADDAWLRASNDRLDEIIARLQRRTALRLDVDPALVSLPVTGRFRLSDPEGSLRLLAETNDLKLVHNADSMRLMRR